MWIRLRNVHIEKPRRLVSFTTTPPANHINAAAGAAAGVVTGVGGRIAAGNGAGAGLAAGAGLGAGGGLGGIDPLHAVVSSVGGFEGTLATWLVGTIHADTYVSVLMPFHRGRTDHDMT